LFLNKYNGKIKVETTKRRTRYMNYDRKVIMSVNSKLESAMKELEKLNETEHKETIFTICAKIKETIINLDALDREEE